MQELPRLTEAGATLPGVPGVPIRVPAEPSSAGPPTTTEERLQLAIDATGLGIWDVDAATGHRTWSKEMRAILGVPVSQAADPAYFSSLIHADDHDWVNEAYAKAYRRESGGSYRIEFRIRRADDSAERWVLITGRVAFDAADRPIRAVGTILDITDRKQTEASLRESEERLQLALADGGLGAWDLDIDAGRRFISPRSAAIMGVKAEDFTDRAALAKVIHSDDVDRVQAAMRRAIEDGAEYKAEFRIVAADGIRWVGSQALVQRDGTGRARRVIGIHQDITERRRNEEILRASEGRFRGVFQSRIAGLTIFDSNTGEKLVMNDRMLEIVGRTRASYDAGEWNCLSITPAEFLHLDYRAIEEARERGSWEPFEKEYVRGDGSRVAVRLSSAPLDSEPGRVVVCVEDISEYKSTRQALEASEARFRALTEASPQLVWSALADGTLDYVSPQWEDYTGVPGREHYGDRWIEALHPADRDRASAAWAGAVRGEMPYDIEFRVRRFDGTYHWFKARASVLRQDGRIARWLGTATDIDEIVRAREALRESEQRLKATQEHAGVGIAEIDAAGRYLRVNETFCGITGYSREELLAKTIFEVTHPVDADTDRERLQRQIAGDLEGPYAVEKRFTRGDGQPGWVAVSASAVRDPMGRFLYGVRVVQDITERKLAEERRQLLLNELNHRVKNTLATVQSIAALTLRSAPTVQAFHESFTARLVALSGTHNLLTHEGWEGTWLRGLVERELAPYEGNGRRRVTLRGERVRVSPQAAVALGLAFHELTTNAAKYGALSGPEGQIRVAWEVDREASRPALRVHWTETGEPAVTPPRRRGFGSWLIERGIAQELAGEVKLAFEPTGLQCSLVLPLDRERTAPTL
jgi:PAS domain S-box-containing protein